jgi:2,4-dienoyl-CoA reductase-like NADH-dependent reductase (Old Yellow Enzyme family)
MSLLFSQLPIKSISFKNRIVVSPMCQYSSVDGFANDWHMVHLGSRAVGGAGLIISEACAVSPEGRISPEDLGIWKDEHVTGLKRITDFIHQQGSVAGIQLAHAGRKASHSSPWQGNQLLRPEHGGWPTWAPSAVAFKDNEILPQALDLTGIQKVTDDFRMAAKRALSAGFKVIEIHAAHGYLIHEFLSPLSNLRDDLYGGSFENRARLLLEILQAVQREWPEELPVFVRISATDWASGGWNIDDSVRLSALLQSAGVDVIDCSSGGLVSYQNISPGPGYQVPFSKQIRRETGILTGAVGLITDEVQAEAILEAGDADLVLLGREFLRDPYFPLKAAKAMDSNISWPVQYERAKLIK